jgi:hypothetical protein
MTTLQTLMTEANAALDDPNVTKERLVAAHLQLNVWHRAMHGGPHNSVLCTGCRIYPVLQALKARIDIGPPTWGQPYRVDVWWWMDLNLWSAPGILSRCGRVSWNQDGTGLYGVTFSDERAGIGLTCWPDFHALSEAQSFVESIIGLPLAQIEARHGQQWREVL